MPPSDFAIDKSTLTSSGVSSLSMAAEGALLASTLALLLICVVPEGTGLSTRTANRRTAKS